MIKLNFINEPHNPVKLGKLPWLYCIKCGLIYLNNDISKWAIAKGCNHSEHPDYKRRLNK